MSHLGFCGGIILSWLVHYNNVIQVVRTMASMYMYTHSEINLAHQERAYHRQSIPGKRPLPCVWRETFDGENANEFCDLIYSHP